MTKEQLAKEAALEWLLGGEGDNIEELLKSCFSHSYKQCSTKKD